MDKGELLLASAMLALAALILAQPGRVRELAGLRPFPALDPAALEAEPAPDDRELGRLLADRDTVRVVVREDMTVADLAAETGIDLRSLRRAVARARHKSDVAGDAMLVAGATYDVGLTPPEAAP